MTYIVVSMYRIECSQDGCQASPQDDSEWYAYTTQDQALLDAQDDDWYTNKDDSTHLCPRHVPMCACKGCDACGADEEIRCAVQLRDDEFGAYCEDCFEHIRPEDLVLA